MNPEPLPTELNTLRAQLSQLLRQVLGTRVELVDYEIGNQRHDYLVVLARLRHPTIAVVIKLAGPDAPVACPFDRTATLHRLVAACTTISMPEVMAVDGSYQTWPWRYFIKCYTPGQEWATLQPRMKKQELSEAYQQIGNAVTQLHSIRFPSFGELATDGSVQDGTPSIITALGQRAERSIQHTRLRDLFLTTLDRYAHLFSDVRTASLCHDDLHRHNILFQRRDEKWHLATILDFDKAWAGHHESDLARLEFWRGMTGQEFWRGYEMVHSVEPLYKQRRPIYQLLWCLEYARPTAEHLADTRRVCAELGIPHVERFE
jgi:aminoglycoside phosphotransferase (APT) family kinase protein